MCNATYTDKVQRMNLYHLFRLFSRLSQSWWTIFDMCSRHHQSLYNEYFPFAGKIMIHVSAGKNWCQMSKKFNYHENFESKIFKIRPNFMQLQINVRWIWRLWLGCYVLETFPSMHFRKLEKKIAVSFFEAFCATNKFWFNRMILRNPQ